MIQHRTSYALIVAGVLLVLVGLVSWQVGWDVPLHHLFRLRGTAWTPVVVQLSALGGFGVMGPVGFLAIGLLLWRRRAGEALWLFTTVASGRLVVEGLKLLITRPRPPLIDRLELVQSWSFPSSHAAGTLMTCLALAVVIGGRPAFVLAFLAALIIGWTRLALAVHWPGDVMAGWGVGLLWLGLALRIHTPARVRPAALAPSAEGSTP
ncbi:phosphatase PAP2 family protein [Sphingomonas sp. ASY06-1R]|uniref:phosphatase PAP2 family protein n=1 Tax=Sphingomonas sp. ASY06-1R TaxID=3445771 RepID=UPI003FA1F12D